MTVRQHAVQAARMMRDAGLDADTAIRDASVLARHVLSWDAARWLSDSDTVASPGFTASFSAFVDRRTRREPLAYILGEREFYGRPFLVTRDVLIPRPETELIVDAVLALTRESPRARMIDIGTGSGCLAVTVAIERPNADVTATDSSAAALDVAADNARRLGVESNVQRRLGDLLAGVDGPFDVIMTNPPYVAETDRPALEPEVVLYEPASALFAGIDGLDAIRRVVAAAVAALAPDGWLVMEIGAGQADAVAHIVAETGRLRLARFVPDLQSIPRVAVVAGPLAQERDL